MADNYDNTMGRYQISVGALPWSAHDPTGNCCWSDA